MRLVQLEQDWVSDWLRQLLSKIALHSDCAARAGSEPCLHNGMEDRQAKQELLEGSLVGAPIEEVGAGEGV